MIPYDDLVSALAAWRARQGLPVAQVPGLAAAPARAPAPPAAIAPAPSRPAPPAAPPRTAPRPVAQEVSDFDGGALIEDSLYDPEGGDFALPLGAGAVETPEESTAIGTAPEPLLTPKRGKRNPDW